MTNQARQTTTLGDLVAAAFDEAERWSTDPREVSLLATQAVANLLRRTDDVGSRGPVEVRMGE